MVVSQIYMQAPSALKVHSMFTGHSCCQQETSGCKLTWEVTAGDGLHGKLGKLITNFCMRHICTLYGSPELRATLVLQAWRHPYVMPRSSTCCDLVMAAVTGRGPL